MKAGSILLAILIAASTLTWPTTTSEGAVLRLGGQEGTEDPPQPTEGAETEEDWNPTVTCAVTPPQNIWDLLECLLDEISNPPPACNPIGVTEPINEVIADEDQDVVQNLQADVGLGDDDCYPYPHDRGDFVVTMVPLPHYGVEIRRLDGGEIERLSLRENDPGIQTTELEMEPLAGRFARIGEIEEVPAGGRLSLTINDEVLVLSTRHHLTTVEVTADLVRGLRASGFRVSYESPYLYVHHDARGIYKIQFRSTDPGITKSDLALFPAAEAPVLDAPRSDPPTVTELAPAQ